MIGVSGVSTEASALYAREAARAGADSVMAMPPYVRHPPASEVYDFYVDVAKAADGLPVWVQDYVAPVGTPIAIPLLARIVTGDRRGGLLEGGVDVRPAGDDGRRRTRGRRRSRA